MKKVYMYIHLKYLFKDEEVSQGIILVSFGHFLLSTDVTDFSEEKLSNLYKFYSTQP